MVSSHRLPEKILKWNVSDNFVISSQRLPQNALGHEHWISQKRKSKNPKDRIRNHQQNHREKSHNPRHNDQCTPSPSTPTSASPNLPIQFPTNHNPLFHFIPNSVTKINGPNSSSKAIYVWDNYKMHGKSKESENGS
jgi:hypothetical protein